MTMSMPSQDSTSDAALQALVERAAVIRRSASGLLKAEDAHRRRSSALLATSALLVLDMMRSGLEENAAAYKAVVDRLEGLGLEPLRGESETRLARLCLGPGVDRKRVYRVAAAARELHASGTNDPIKYLEDNGGVTGCVKLWGQRNAATHTVDAAGGVATCGTSADRSEPSPTGLAEWAAGALGRRMLATVEFGPGGAVILRCLRGPLYALVEVVEPGGLTEGRRRQLRVVRRGRGEPVRLLVETGHEILSLVADGLLRVVAQADDPDSPLLALSEAAEEGAEAAVAWSGPTQ